jgi:signal transduction histidine kinase
MSSRQNALARLSIEHKLPLVIGTLLLIVVIALSTAAYIEARHTTIRVNEQRLTSLAGQLRDLFQTSGTQLRRTTRAIAEKPEIGAYAKSRQASQRDAALAALKYTGSSPDQVIGTELRDISGAILLTTNASVPLDTVAIAPLLKWSEERDSVVIGRFRFLRDTIAYPIVAPLKGTNASLVHWRRLVGSRRTREMMTQLIGSEASVFLGNPGLDRWTDLERPVPAPPIDSSFAQRGTQNYERNSQAYLASVAAIPGTPWFVAIDFPYRAMLIPANDFLRRMVLIALAALGVSLLAGYFVSRRISRPLRDLTDAAVAVASGDFSRGPRIKRHDELGRLGDAFATMASEVQGAREDLERKVELRTADLNATLQQLHEAQDALVRREKLALLGQLASGVGHELRNPLGVMTNAVYYLKTVLRSQPLNVQEYLEIVQQQITLSEKIVGDLLDFARSKSPQRKPSHLHDIVDAQLARLGASPGTVIETDLPGNLPPVRVDPAQVGQIILNLLTNAVQAINGHGGRILVRATIAGDHVQCEVVDNGAGIAREHLEKIFEPLFTTKARGIGLGLAVSRQLARANNGELTVSSSIGQGATFRLWLPIATGEAA